ncbi:MAG: aldo/keto reductase [Eubacterium sp.]|nr:aldo/keto reductase [Eubacterium sp.]
MDKKEFILSNGIVIPAVGYGSYLSTEKNGRSVIKDALDVGYRYIDTARMYENEFEIGQALEEYGIAREELFLCSKVWPRDLSKESLVESFEATLADLKTDYLDMLLIHWPKYDKDDESWLDKVLDAWSEMERLYDEKKIRAIGVSNFLPHHLAPMLEKVRIKPMVDQLELHVGYMQEYTLKYLEENGILPQAWSPLGRAKVLQDERVSALAVKYGKSNAQVLLRFLNQRGIPVIPKASSIERMKENLDIFDFTLNDDEISYLSCIPEYGWSGEHPDLGLI